MTRPDGTSDSTRRTTLVVAGLLAVALVAAYAPVRHAGWFYLDDDFYVTDNPFVRDGLTLGGLRQAFFGSRGGLWMPLAFTSHMLDVSTFGMTPVGPHLVNVALHVVNVLLLLALLVRTTGALAPSLAVAALFGLHPMRVESVAWVAERKDVLAALFGLLTMHAWVRWVRAPSDRTYRLVALGTLLALLSKPMLVTLPLLLLCLDVWPLRRLGTPDADGRPLDLRALGAEKVPLVAVACAAAAITLLAAGMQGALVGLEGRSLPTRIVHALVSSVWYAAKTAWPSRLGVFYPYPHWAWWQIAGAVAVVGTTVALALTTWRRAPWIAAGVAWFAIGLAPVLGFFQAGGQGMADRFTYVPAIGLLVALVWTVHEAVERPALRAVLAGTTVLVALGFGIATHRQASYWTSSERLLARTIEVTTDNWRMESALGSVLANQGRPTEAEVHYTNALRIEPGDPTSEYGLGLVMDGLGRPDDAVPHYRAALRIDPDYWRAHNNLGVFLVRHGDVEGALHHFSEAVRLNPAARDATDNLKSTLAQAGFPKENVDGYVQGLLTWSSAIANDQRSPGGARYGELISQTLLAGHPAVVSGCLGGIAKHAPFSLYLQIDESGALTAVTAIPPTAEARCIRDELKTAHAPSPPFAPFHASIEIAAQS